jgi:hypothetical protein
MRLLAALSSTADAGFERYNLPGQHPLQPGLNVEVADQIHESLEPEQSFQGSTLILGWVTAPYLPSCRFAIDHAKSRLRLQRSRHTELTASE